jgi:6-phosphogluconolactonase
MKIIQKLIAFLSLLLAMACASSPGPPERIFFYVGSSDGSLSHPIYLCELDYNSGLISVIDSFPGSKSSSYLALSPDQGFLYALDGTQSDPEKKHPSVASFRVTDADGRLEMMNRQSAEGRGPCHVSCHPDGSHIFIANYSEGNVAAYPLDKDGSIKPASDVVQHAGSGPNTRRQTKAFAHHISAVPGGKFVVATDLGADRVFIYRFDAKTGGLTPNPEQASFEAAAGAGPRHLAFHPTEPYLFIVNELNGTTTACTYDGQNGKIKEINTLDNLPEDMDVPDNYPAAVRIHPNGHYVYSSNRVGHNSISVFRIGENGEIERRQVMEDVPEHPRDFNIDPHGKFLLAAGQRGNAIEIFRIDPDTGLLSRTGQIVPMKAPACILFRE